MKNEIKETEILSKIELIREKAPRAFSSVSESYRQKVVYNLLNIVRSGDMSQFLWTLLRLLNARRESDEAKELVKIINELYGYESKFFEKWAYSIIMGIMSAKE